MGIAQKRSTNPSCPPRSHKPPGAVLALCSDSSHHTLRRAASKQRLFKIGQIGGYILPITIQNRNKMTARAQKTRPNRRTLPSPAMVAQNAQLRNRRLRVCQFGGAVIAAGIIDIDDFEISTRQRRTDFIDQRANIASFVHHWNQNRYFG